MGSGGPGEGPTLLSHRAHPCCQPSASPSPDQEPVLWVLTECQAPSQVEAWRETPSTPWGPGGAYFSHQLPPPTMHTSSHPQGLATAQERTCPKDPLCSDL